MWESLVDAVREVTAAHPNDARGVVALGVCSQYSSVVPIDHDARPVAAMLMWQDQRGTDHSLEIMARDENAFLTFVDRHCIPPVGGGLSLAHILYVQNDRPAIHERTAAYVEAMDYVTARLTGRITASRHSTYMYQLCDNRALDPPAYAPAAAHFHRRPGGTDPGRGRERARPPRVDDRVRGHQRHRDRRGCDRRVRARTRRHLDRHDQRAGRRARWIPGRPRAPTLRDARSVSRPLRRLRRERPRRQAARTRAPQSDSRGRRARRSRLARAVCHARPRAGRHRGGRGRGHVPPLARGRERAAG